MTLIELYISGYSVDLYEDEKIKSTIQVNDVGDVQNRQASYTDSFSIPKTTKNVSLMNGLGISSDTSRIPYERPQCQMKLDGFDFIVNGWFNVKDTTDEYKVYVYSGVINFFKALENKTLADIVGTELNHEKNLETVVASFSSPIMKYLITDYNGLTHYGANNEIVNIDYLIPSVNTSYLFHKIHEKTNFIPEGNIFNTTDFTNLWLTYPKFISVEESTEVAKGKGEREISTFNSNGNQAAYYRSVFFTQDVIGLSSTTSFTADEDADYRVVLKIIDTFQYPLNATLTYFLSLNQESIPYINRSGEAIHQRQAVSGEFLFERIIPLSQGDVISFYSHLVMNGYLRWTSNMEITINKITPGIGDFSTELQEFPAKDFIKEILTRFGLTLIPDEFSNNLKYETLQERLVDAEIIDWSDKYESRDGEEYVYSSYAQKNWFRYKYLDQDASYSDSNISIINQNIDEDKTVFTSKTYSPEKTISEFFLGSIGFLPLRVFKIYNKEIKENEDEITIEYKGLDKKFYFAKADRISSNITIGSKTLLSNQNVSEVYIASFFELQWSNILNKYYKPFGRLINDSRIHEISLNLNTVDILQLDLSKLYFFDQEQQYYILNKLNFDEKNAKGEFVRVKRFYENNDTVIPPETTEVEIIISWLDNSTEPKEGFDSTTIIKRKSVSTTANVELVSFDWEKNLNDSGWNSLASGSSPFTVNLDFGVQKFRTKAIDSESNEYYSNEIQFTKPEMSQCYHFRIHYRATFRGEEFRIDYLNCQGMPTTAIQYASYDGEQLEDDVCALMDSVETNGSYVLIGMCD